MPRPMQYHVDGAARPPIPLRVQSTAIRLGARIPPLSALLLVVPVGWLTAGAWARRWTSDDAFITFRVVRHVLEGYGPVFNAAERVEAYTHPLWLAWLVIAGLLTPELEMATCVLGLTCGAAAMAIGGITGFRLRGQREGLVIPAGLIAFAALPPAWDFTTSGLEMSMVFLWLAAAWGLVSALPRSPQWLGRALFCTGLGVLIRPDLALFAVPLTAAALVAAPGRFRARPGRCLAAWALLPAAYLCFRMMYFGAVLPSPGIAKNAFTLYPDRGLRYALNFIRPYALWIPALGCLVAVAVAWRDLPRVRRARAALLAGAALHAGYIVAIGGDFMHARLLLPSAFAVALAAGSVPVSLTRRGAVTTGAAVALVIWAVVCSVFLRPPIIEDPVAQFVDERRFYSNLAGREHPVRLRDFANSGWMYTPQQYPTLNGSIFVPNLGIAGFSAGTSIRVVDEVGLADPIAARLRQIGRGRAGHERHMPREWYLARVAPEDVTPAVAAAREALSCGPLAELMAAITEPWTLSRALRNVGVAVRLRNLGIPADPSQARRKFCGPASSS